MLDGQRRLHFVGCQEQCSALPHRHLSRRRWSIAYPILLYAAVKNKIKVVEGTSASKACATKRHLKQINSCSDLSKNPPPRLLLPLASQLTSRSARKTVVLDHAGVVILLTTYRSSVIARSTLVQRSSGCSWGSTVPLFWQRKGARVKY